MKTKHTSCTVPHCVALCEMGDGRRIEIQMKKQAEMHSEMHIEESERHETELVSGRV